MLTKLGKSYYVEKKSESTENTEKNPTKYVKKSEKPSEKNPTYSSTIFHPSSNHSSSSLPPQKFEEEEIVSTELIPLDPYSIFSEERIAGLTKGQIVAGIERIIAANAGDEGPYRARLIEEILSGNGRTLNNIRRQFSTHNTLESRWVHDNRLKREEGERIQQALLDCGFSNPGEAYAASKNEGRQDDF